MATSYNGWTAAPGWTVAGGQLEPLVVAGEPFSPGVRAGDVHDVLEYVFNRVHNEVEPIVRPDWHQADDWGYSYRPNTNNPAQLSCHASATAGDYNATRHPNGKGGTWTAAQKAKILEILAAVDNVVRVLWGYDEMHFEICASVAKVAQVAARLRNGTTRPPKPTPSGPTYEAPRDVPLGSRVLGPGNAGTDVEFVQRWHGLKVDGQFGPLTEQAVRNTQERNGVKIDGEVGPITWRLMGIGSAKPAPPVIPPLPRKPVWDLPRGHYFGDLRGPNESHGGGVDLDRDNVLWIQRKLIAAGCVPGVGDWRDGWADGKWETATTAAVQMWFARYRPGQKYTTRIYRDDYAAM